jgi:multicomponent K+:H+ antiporter subunit A/multicomponent Na+:H+ antiporter subunit A
MDSPNLLTLAVAAPLLAALVAPFVGRALGARAGWLLSLAFVPGLLLLTSAGRVRAGEPLESLIAWVPTLGLDLAFRADGFSLMFALLVAGIGLLVMLYAGSYLGAGERHGRFYSYLLLFGGAMLGLVLVDNLYLFFAFWEMTSITSFLLIGFWDGRRASQDGALKALVVTMIGGLALLVAVILLAQAGGTDRISQLDLTVLSASPLFLPALALALLAAFTKSAQLPFHLWLPTAMEAPTPVSAYLHSATMVKAGVILVAKFGFLLEGTALSQLTLYVGLATLFWGSYLALRQTDLKALLAYSTVSQLGILIALYGAGHPYAATAHLVNHAAFKAALFLVVGIIDHETGSRDLSRLSGLRRKLPITALLAVPAALSMAGLPPFGGFISKELFYEGMLHEGTLAILIAVVGSVMTFAYSLRFLSVFFGPYRSEKPDVHEASPPFWIPLVPLVLATIVFGLVPFEDTIAGWFTGLAAASFGYSNKPLALWHGLNLALALSVLTWFLGVALFVVRTPFASLQRALTPSWNVNTIYYAMISGLERFASGLVRLTLGARFATHVRLILAALALIGTLSWWRFVPTEVTPVPISVVLVALLIVGGAIGVLVARSRLSALIFMGLAGFGSSLAFVLLRAPDLALTQLLIETVTVILFLSVFRYLPVLTRYARSVPTATLDAVVALGAGMTVFTLLIAVQTPVGDRISEFFLTFSKSVGGGYNVVNVILVDFRGYDTMGEIAVLGVVAVSVMALLRLTVRRRTPDPERPEPEAGSDAGEPGGAPDA